MKGLGNPLVRLRLLGRMSRIVDVDLVKAFETGLIDNESWAAMIASCRSCSLPHQCTAWMEDHETASSPPRGCQNAEFLMWLKEILEMDDTA